MESVEGRRLVVAGAGGRAREATGVPSERLFPLRPRQQDALDKLKTYVSGGVTRVQIQAPCGFGKTILAAHIVEGARRKGNRAAFVAPCLSLIDQTFERFRDNGIDPGDMGVIQGNHPWCRPAAPIQICSIQTVDRRGFPDAKLVVVDESHVGYGAIAEWMEARPGSIFIGLSATPWRKGMREEWQDNLIVPATTKDLIEEGHLAKYRAFAPSKPDLAGIRTVAGDYHEGQLADRMSEAKIVGDVVQTWCERGENRPTLLFAVNRRHAAVLEAQFRAAGVASSYVDANTPREERLELKDAFHTGKVKVVCSVGTMIAGVDWDVRCISFVRPTRSEILLMQAMGRGLRTAEGKEDLLILDHAGALLSLGLPDGIHHDRMFAKKAKGARRDGEKEAKSAPAPVECQSCGLLFSPGAISCPACGHEIRRAGIKHAEGELVQIRGRVQRKVDFSSMEDKARFYGELKLYAKSRGYKDGWAANQYRAKFGVWPDAPSVRNAAEAEELSPEVAGWIRSRQIAWARSHARA
jgi:DNA repair protein RadD